MAVLGAWRQLGGAPLSSVVRQQGMAEDSMVPVHTCIVFVLAQRAEPGGCPRLCFYDRCVGAVPVRSALGWPALGEGK